LTSTIKRIRNNENFQTILVIALIVISLSGLWFGAQVILNTSITPVLAVTSGSMCIPYGSGCTDWHSITHPFDRTLHTGDLIIIQGIDPKRLNIEYPNSDIIVYQNPWYPTDPNEKIVHRIVGSTEINGTLYFYTKGDGNPYNKWPNTLYSGEYDPWSPIPAEMIYGKVIMRIPWLGHLPIFMQNLSGNLGFNISYIVILAIVIIIMLLVVNEFVMPFLKWRCET
jgi:signal peptidase I